MAADAESHAADAVVLARVQVFGHDVGAVGVLEVVADSDDVRGLLVERCARDDGEQVRSILAGGHGVVRGDEQRLTDRMRRTGGRVDDHDRAVDGRVVDRPGEVHGHGGVDRETVDPYHPVPFVQEKRYV